MVQLRNLADKPASLMLAVIAALLILAASSPGAQAACSWTTLSNGTTADALAVMNNLDCLAPITTPSLVGAVSIAPSGGNVLSPSNLKIRRGWMGAPAADEGGINYQYNGGLAGNNEALVFDSGASGSDYRFKTGGIDRLVISGAGGGVIGIGTISPAFGIDVETANGNTSAKFGNAYPIYLVNNSPIVGYNMYFSGGWKYGKGSVSAYGAAVAVDTSTGTMNYFMSNTAGNAGAAAMISTRMTLTQPGNLGIGTASPAQKLDVAGTIRQSNCTTAGTLSVNSSGDIICTSDARLKNILGRYTVGLDAIARIRPQRFNFKPTNSNPVETFVHAGFIAQDVKVAIPEAVAMQKNGFYSLDTTAIIAASVNAIKELNALNKIQTREIADLKARLRAVEARATPVTY